MKNYNLFILLLLLVGLSACRKDSQSTTTTTVDIPAPATKYEVSIQGFVTDENGVAMADVAIKSDDHQTMTNEFGFYSIDTRISNRKPTVTISKTGYFDSYAQVIPAAGRLASLDVTMVERSLAGSFEASSGGRAETLAGAKIDFAPDGIIDASGNAYLGEVQVFARYYDPTTDVTQNSVASNLLAIDQDNNERVLESYGMLNVELETPSGAPLQLSQDATLEMPVPASLQGTAPSSIPLWHYDTELGRWMEEGSAELVGNVYKGSVSHFTLWNCDVPHELVILKAQFEQNGYYPKLKILITVLESGQQRSAYTDKDGAIFGYVPKDKLLLIEAIDLSCEEAVVFTEEIGPLSVDHAVNFDISNNGYDWEVVSGTALDCDNNPVQNGMIIIKKSTGRSTSVIIEPSDNGQFETLINTCSNTEIIVVSTDFDNALVGPEVTFNLPTNSNGIEVQSCGETLISKIEFTSDGLNHLISNCTVTRETLLEGEIHYQFKALDDLGNENKVLYQMDIINWTGDPNDPLYAVSFTHTIFGAPDTVLLAASEDIVLELDNTEPGELISIRITDAAVTNTVDNEIWLESEIEIVGLIQN